jgi:glutamate N-acetyltransferase/amino-acid N-acetyltransferase
LVKTALFGEGPNWGKTMVAPGRAGVPVDPDRIDICFDDVMMVKGGVGCGEEAESRVAEAMKGMSSQ